METALTAVKALTRLRRIKEQMKGVKNLLPKAMLTKNKVAVSKI